MNHLSNSIRISASSENREYGRISYPHAFSIMKRVSLALLFFLLSSPLRGPTRHKQWSLNNSYCCSRYSRMRQSHWRFLSCSLLFLPMTPLKQSSSNDSSTIKEEQQRVVFLYFLFLIFFFFFFFILIR